MKPTRPTRVVPGAVLGVVLAVAASVAAAPARAGWLDDAVDWARSWFQGPPAPPAPKPEAKPAPAVDLFPELPTVRFAEQSLHVKVPEPVGEVKLVVTRSSVAGEKIRVRYRTVAEGGATAGRDFAAAEGDVTFKDDARETEIRIRVIDDKEHEPTENFVVVLEALAETNAVIDPARSRAVIAIEDDDPPTPSPKPARLVAAPARVVFKETAAGAEAQAEVMIMNKGGGETVVSRPRMAARAGQATAFSVGLDECAARVLPPGGACAVVFMFRPARDGFFEADVDVGASAGAGTSLGLAGRGRVPLIVDDPEKAKVAALREARRLGGGTIQSLDVPPPEPVEPIRYRTKDPDWAQTIGIGRNYFSLPVDRARIITVFRKIPCVLEDTINSQIGGFVHCQIEGPVFGEDGRMVLLPGGSRMVGDFQPLSKTGDTRLNVVWRQIMRPDGSRINIADGFQSIDPSGRTGLPGYVDNRFFERFGTAFLLTAVTTGSALAVPQDNEQFAQAFRNLADNFNSITAQILEENLDLRPTITIPAGTRLAIIPLADLWFPTVDRIVPLAAAAARQGPAAARPSAQQAQGKAPAQKTAPVAARETAGKRPEIYRENRVFTGGRP